MILTLDNLDGLGAVDYSAAIAREEPIEIVRTLNAPSAANGVLCLEGTALKVPVRRARVTLMADSGTLLFTGYLTTEPVPVYAGVADAGPVYRLAFRAASDEWLLDKQSAGVAAGVLGQPGGAAVAALLARVAPGVFTTTGIAAGQTAGVLGPEALAAFSTQVGAVADATYAAYRVLGGALLMAQAGVTSHALSPGDGTLDLGALHTASVRELANDVTVSGAEEPTIYWQEVFAADGITPTFTLTGEPAAPSAGHARLIADDFAQAAFDRGRWQVADPGSRFSFGAAGLLFNGGNGLDGQTTLQGAEALELGGSLLLELAQVTLAAASAGVLCGLYSGTVSQANCFAGFNVRQSGGNTIVTPMVAGVEVGTPFTVDAGVPYTLHLRVNSQEPVRVLQNYYARVDGVLERFGGGVVESPVLVTFEIRNLNHASNTVATVLYDGAVADAPGSATFCAVDSVQLFGSVGSVLVERTGTALVRSTDAQTGAVTTRLLGSHLYGNECSLGAGTLTFFAGVVPAVGTLVKVAYRGRRRAVARLADAASVAAEAAGGASGTSRWLGRVLSPPARCAADCENAAQAVLAFATDRAAALEGSCTVVNPPGADVWPGDVLVLDGGANVLVRKVTVAEQGAAPEALLYRIAFANDWAEGLGLRLSEAIAGDALLPDAPLELAPGQTPASSGHVLANLAGLAVLAFQYANQGGTAAMTLDAGVDPPAGGGFEVRRHDGGFGAGLGAASAAGDLVLRTPVRTFSLPRAATEERFFIRMYDGSTPPRYSRESAGVLTHVPLETA